MTGRTERLLDVETADGLVLPGALIGPSSGADTCVVWHHGFAMSYDYRPCVALGRALAAAGTAMLTCASRGHDGGVTGWRRADGRWRIRRIGSWYEVLEETAYDIDAWLAVVRSLGYPRIVLAGHSFATVKLLHYLSLGGASIDGLILASPSMRITQLDQATADLAHGMVARGEGERLLPDGSWPYGFGTKTVSAQTIASWDRVRRIVFADPAPWKASIAAPVLAYYGDRDEVGGQAELATFTGGMTGAAAVRTRILPGIEHNYQQGTETIAGAILAWLRECVVPAAPARAPTGGTL